MKSKQTLNPGKTPLIQTVSQNIGIDIPIHLPLGSTAPGSPRLLHALTHGAADQPLAAWRAQDLCAGCHASCWRRQSDDMMRNMGISLWL